MTPELLAEAIARVLDRSPEFQDANPLPDDPHVVAVTDHQGDEYFLTVEPA
jgi:hypothetical protein